MTSHTRSLFVALLLGSNACSSPSEPAETSSEVLRSGELTIHHGDDVHSTTCSSRGIRRDAAGNPSFLQDDGELTAVCFQDDRLGISFSVQEFLTLGASFDLMNDERVDWFAEFPVGDVDASLSSNAAEQHRFQGTYDAVANHLLATLSASYAATTPDAQLGTLGQPTTFELAIDFRAE